MKKAAKRGEMFLVRRMDQSIAFTFEQLSVINGHGNDSSDEAEVFDVFFIENTWQCIDLQSIVVTRETERDDQHGGDERIRHLHGTVLKEAVVRIEHFVR